MENFKVGDVVARRSYGYDILFKIDKIEGDIAELVGMTVRIIADSPIYDLKKISKEEARKKVNEIDVNSRLKINRCYTNLNTKFNMRNEFDNRKVKREDYIYEKESIYRKPGVVLHLDGDADYAIKCKETYKKMGVTAHVYNIKESDQPRYVYSLLNKIRPNILIMTGHDAFIRKRNDIYNIDNYKNSKYFIEGVLEARRYEHNLDNLVIFAGACQSYYEAIMSAGANFSSAPKRVLIDMLDPIIVAESVAYTPVDKFVPLAGIISNTREGLKGIGGVQTRGQYREGMPGM